MMTRAQRRRDSFFIECAEAAGLKVRAQEMWAKRLDELIDRNARLENQAPRTLVAARAIEIGRLKAAV